MKTGSPVKYEGDAGMMRAGSFSFTLPKSISGAARILMEAFFVVVVDNWDRCSH